LKCKILIVGGGVMGAAIAVRAARRTDPVEEPVVLIERGALADGSSGRSGAILRQFYTDREVAAMARDSLREYAGFRGRTGRNIGFTKAGVLVLADPGDDASRATLESSVAMMREIGVECSLLGADRIREVAPGIDVADDTVACWEPGGGFVDPVRAVNEFAGLARSYGAVTRTGLGAEKLVVEAGRVRGVETPDGPIEAEQVVVVAGPWTGALLATCGVDLPLRVVRPEQYFHAMPEAAAPEPVEAPSGSSFDMIDRTSFEVTDQGEEVDPAIVHPVLADLSRGFYTRCDPPSLRTRVGRLDYADDDVLADPDALDEAVGDEMRSFGRRVLTERFPRYGELDEAGTQAAWYTLTPDAQPMLGPVPGVEGLFVAAGFSGHGFKLAPSVAEGLVQKLFGEPVSAYDEAFFSPARFAGREVEWAGRFGM
jgi:glycine/D-amino acid oxidase-like deaminating enzyme